MGAITWAQDITSPRVGDTVEITATFAGAEAISSLVVGDFEVEDQDNNTITPTNFDLTGRVVTFGVTTMAVGNLIVTVAANAGGTGNPPAVSAHTVIFLAAVAAAVSSRRGREASANPAADNFGTNILGIVAEQIDYFTPQTLSTKMPTAADLTAAKVNPNVIEFRPPYSLTPVKEFYPVERYKGNPSPDPSIPGMQMGAGEIHFYLDATSIPFWLKHLLQMRNVAPPRAFGLHTVTSLTPRLAAGADADKFGAAASFLDPQQPRAIIQAIIGSGTQPEPPSGMTAGKIKLTFTALSDETDFRFEGKDHNGAPVTDIVTAAASATSVVSNRYFADGVQISKKGTGAQALTKVEVDLSGVFEHELEFDSQVSEGLSLEVREGNLNTPIRYNGLIVSRGIISLEEVARFRAMVIANEAHPREALHTPNTGDRDATAVGGYIPPTDNPFKRLPFHAIPAPGMSWEVGGDNVPESFKGTFRVASIGMAIDNRIAPPRTAYAETFFYPKPVRKMNRELQLQVAIDYSKEADFDRFVGGLTFESTLSAASKGYGDAYRAIRITGKQCQIVNNPTRIAGDLAEVLQQIVTRMHIGNNPDGNDEAEFRVINTEPTI